MGDKPIKANLKIILFRKRQNKKIKHVNTFYIHISFN